MCCTVLQPAVFRSCNACRTLRRGSFFRRQGGHLLNRSWNSSTGCQSASGSTTSWPFWHTRSVQHPHRPTSAITSDLGNLHVNSVHPPCRYFTDRLREHISPTALSYVVHPLSGTRWTLKHYTVALLVDLNADLKHYFSVRHSVARLELSTSASEVIRHAGAI